jgi:hypothetical protein
MKMNSIRSVNESDLWNRRFRLFRLSMRANWPLAIMAFCAGQLLSQTASTTSGEFITEPPTFISLGFEWRITGDQNRNAHVDVKFPEDAAKSNGVRAFLSCAHRTSRSAYPPAPAGGRGTDGCRARYPLFKYTAPNMFVGSILNLEPDTEYECRFTLADPDGVTGRGGKDGHRSHSQESRSLPKAATSIMSIPVDWKGPKQEPAFTGLMAAYYMGLAHFDYENAFPPRVQPGDIILVHAGLYVGDRFHYMNGQPRPGYLAMGNLFDGTYYLTQSGTPDKPIVIKGAGDGEVIFDGDGCQTFFNLMAANYNYFEGITFPQTPMWLFSWASKTLRDPAASR